MSDATEQSPAEQQKPKVLINPPVFFTSVAIIAAMVLAGRCAATGTPGARRT